MSTHKLYIMTSIINGLEMHKSNANLINMCDCYAAVLNMLCSPHSHS